MVANGDSLILIDSEKLEIRGRLDANLGKSITSLSFQEKNFKGEGLLVGTVDTLSIYSLEKDNERLVLKGTRNVGDKITTATWVHRRIAVGGWNRIRLFNENLVEIGGVEYAHQGNVAGLCASREPGVLVSIGHDGLVKEWMIREMCTTFTEELVSSVDTLDSLFGGIQQS